MFNDLPRNARYIWQGVIRSFVGAAVAGAFYLSYRFFWAAADASGYVAVAFFLCGLAFLPIAFLSIWWIGGGRFRRNPKGDNK